MADSFNDRKRAAEAKWARDADLRFKVMARRDRLLGQWAAGLKGITGAEADAYAKTVIVADLEEAGDEDVFRKLRGDLDAAVTDTAIRTKMDELLVVAHDQLEAEAK